MDSAKKPRTVCARVNGLILNGGQLRRSILDEELSKLEAEIKKAYVLKALHAQLAERQANQMAVDIQAKIVDKIEQFCADTKDEERDRLEKSARLERANELKAVLERQIDEKRKERRLLEEDERQERMVLVEVDRLREEREWREKARDKEQLAEQLCLESLLHNEIREIDKHTLKELEAKESLMNETYLKELDERANRLAKMRQDALRKREDAIEAVAKVLVEIERAKKERERLLDDIVFEEVKFETEIEAREAELQRRRKMRELAEDLKEQIRFEYECRMRFLEREKEFAEAVMAKVMESERIERLTMEVKRQRRLEYRRELERIMKERECARVRELERLRLSLEEERLAEEAEREEARKARMLLLEKHIDSVADFMSRKSLYEDERAVVEGSRQKK